MHQQGIPLEGPSKILWEQRLQQSSEPIAFFALANTFAGTLAAFLIIMLAMGMSAKQNQHLWLIWGPMILVTAYCLILTKSRTAWLGLTFGSVVWIGIGIWHSHLRKQTDGGTKLTRPWLIRSATAVLVVIGGLFTLASFSGGFDRAVLSEAPKSMQYRLEYWTGTWQVIRDRILMGTGPGNFRQHYLKYKLPESSEEIADPHNLFLDTWANGGMIGLLGMTIVVAAIVHAVFVRPAPNAHSMPVPPNEHTDEQVRSWLLYGACSSFLIVSAASFLLGRGLDLRLVFSFGGFVGLLLLLRILTKGDLAWQSTIVSNYVVSAAAVALVIHLLGAGGIGMPAIGQTLLLLLAMATVPAEHELVTSDTTVPQNAHPRVVAGIGALLFVLSAACLFTATKPVLMRDALMSTGNVELMIENDSRRAMERYQQAAAADVLSPVPWEHLAELSYQLWKSSPVPNSESFEPVVEFASLAIENDPYSSRGFRKLGNWYLEAYNQVHNATYGQGAIENLSRSVERYPNHAELRSELAQALSKTGHPERAIKQALTALRLDEINHRAGHADKYLSSEITLRLRTIVGELPQNAPLE